MGGSAINAKSDNSGTETGVCVCVLEGRYDFSFGFEVLLRPMGIGRVDNGCITNC